MEKDEKRIACIQAAASMYTADLILRATVYQKTGEIHVGTAEDVVEAAKVLEQWIDSE